MKKEPRQPKLPRPRTRKANKSKNKDVEEKDIFDDLMSSSKTKEPRHSVANLDMAKTLSSDPKRPMAFFNMSGGKRDSDSTSENDAIKELEEENKRLQTLIEYKDYELNKRKKEEEFGYDCFSDLRQKFDFNLKTLEERNLALQDELANRDRTIEQLQVELSQKNSEIDTIEDRYALLMSQKKAESQQKLDQLRDQLTAHTMEVAESMTREIEEVKK